MVEGPTAKAYAIRITNEFRNEIVRNISIKSKKVLVPKEEIIGKRFHGSNSFGKNILLFFDNKAIRIHLMMFGAIHIYGINDPLLKPKERVRLMVAGDRKKLVVYNAPIVELDEKSKILGRLRRELGPDPLSNEWDGSKAFENIVKFSDEKIGTVLLNQSVIAGIGNILRNEILFRAGINPERKIRDLSAEEIKRIVDFARKLSDQFLDRKLHGKQIKDLLYVYNRFSGFCTVCAHPIKFYMQKPINRKTFVCENCQK
ncbi:hypothetical protein KEJ37_05475 [Candidatus Bathyarchaeota archaeon]|nr:hypothetical protein [Candidatus Bathyarchaeota archaeon]